MLGPFRWRKALHAVLGRRSSPRRAASSSLVIEEGVAASIDPAARIVVQAGRLTIGKVWPGLAPLPAILNVERDARIEIAGNFDICIGCFVTVNRGAELRTGSGYMNYRGTIECFERVELGRNVIIGPDVVIRDSDNHVMYGSARPSAPVRIDDDVWIGHGAMILKGVTVGKGAVVAARAVVTRDVPPATLVAGVPARVVREHVAWI